MSSYIAVLIGGAIGAFLRFAVGQVLAADPWTTLGINLAGCLILGFFTTYAAQSGRVPEAVRLGFGTGVVGGFTTFSTFSVQSVTLLQAGAFFKLALYLFGSLPGGVLAAWLGTRLAGKAVRS